MLEIIIGAITLCIIWLIPQIIGVIVTKELPDKFNMFDLANWILGLLAFILVGGSAFICFIVGTVILQLFN